MMVQLIRDVLVVVENGPLATCNLFSLPIEEGRARFVSLVTDDGRTE
jgi:hypothetical protein